MKRDGDLIAREVQYSTINNDGILTSYDIYHEQKGVDAPKISTAFQTLQIYSGMQLCEMLERNGFEVLQQSDIDGNKFDDKKTERILTIARKAS